MQEEVTQKTIALVIKTAKLDANVLKAAMRMYLNHRRQKAQKTHGKTSVKKLVGEGVGVSSIEVTDGNIKSFERVARKYNVNFAVKKDKTTDPPKYVVFFKGRDADAVAQAFKCFLQALFGKSCKIFLENVASPNWRKLQSLNWQLSCQLYSHCRPNIVVTA